MAAVGSLRVELELNDGSFTTRVIRAGTTLQQLESQVGKSVVAVRRLDSTFQSVGAGVRDFVLTLGLARAAVENVATVIGGLPATILRAAGEIERLTNLMRGMSQAATEMGRAQDAENATRWITDLAQRAPFSLETLTGAFVRLRAAGIDPMNGSMQSLVDAVAAFGGSKEQLERAAVAIQQMAGKGVISMEELRQQLGEAVPSAIPLMARAMNVTVDELVNKISQGRVRAEPALAALRDEMTRTFGGAAAQQMETYRGQLQRLETQWTLLRTRAAGNPGSGGFLDAVTNSLRELNQELAGPEIQGFAMRVGQSLRDLTNLLTNTVKFIYENAEAFKALGLAVGAIGGWMLLTSAVSTLATAMTAFYLTSLVPAGRALAAIATGTIPFAVAAFTSLFGAINLASLAMGRFVIAAIAAARIVGVFGAIQIAVASLGTAISGGLSLALASMVGVFQTVRTAITGFVAALFSGGAAAVSFRLALVGLAGAGIAGGIVLAIDLIGRAIDWLRRKFNNLTADSGAAFERLRQGAADTATIMTASQEADEMRQRAQQIQADRAQIDRLRNANVSPTNILSSLRGDDARELARAQARTNSAALESVYEALGRRQQELEQGEQERRTQIHGARLRQIEQYAQIEADTAIRQIEAGTQNQRNAYNQAASDIAQARLQVAANSELTTEQRQAQYGLIDQEFLAAQRRLADQLVEIYETRLAAARIALAEATNPQQQATQTGIIQRLESEIEKLKQLAQRGGADLARALTMGFGEDTIARQADTRIANMEQRLAQMNDQAMGGEGTIARITQLLNTAGWDRLPQATRDRMLELAQQTEEAERKLRAFQNAQQAMGRIDDGLRRQTAELERYTQLFTNPNMAEAQRGFITFQTEMLNQLAQVAVRTGMIGTEWEEAVGRVTRAIDGARNNSVFAQVADIVRQANQARLQNLSPNERLQEELKIRNEIIETLKKQIETAIAAAEATIAAGGAGVAAAEQELAGLRAAQEALDRAKTALDANSGRRADRGNAAAGQSTENQITRLTARLAEMRSEIATGQGEYAKLLAQLERTGRVNTPAGQQMLNLARQIDELAVNAERARSAWGALNDIVRQGATGQGAASEALMQLGQNGVAEPRQIIQALGRIRGAVSELQATGGNADQIRQAEERAQAAMAGIRSRYAAEQAVQYADQANQLRASLANSMSERRAHMEQVMNLERQQFERTVQLSNMSEEQKRQALAASADYYAMRQRQIVQETENGVERMMRSWGNLADNTFDSMASGIDKLTDAIVEFATTGKANFADLAKAILADLARIQMRALVSGIFKLVGGMFSGGGDYTSGVSGPGGTMVGGRHSGGILGADAPTFTRMVDMAMFSAAKRYHTGGMLSGDEVPAILQKGEGVFTQGQMAAIGRMNHSYTMVEQGIAQLVRAIPERVAPRSYDAMPMTRGAGGAPPVTVNLKNESGQQLTAMAGTPQFDIDGMVIDVVIRNAQRPGPLRDLMRGGGS